MMLRLRRNVLRIGKGAYLLEYSFGRNVPFDWAGRRTGKFKKGGIEWLIPRENYLQG